MASLASPLRSLLPGINLGAAFTLPLSLLARTGAEGGLVELAPGEIDVEFLVGASKLDSACGGSVTAFMEGENSLTAKVSFPSLVGPEFCALLLSASATSEQASSTGGCLTCVRDRVTCSNAI